MARPLKSYAIGWACPHVDHAYGAERGLTRGDAVRAVNLALNAFIPLTALINVGLAKAKSTLDPEIGSASSELAIFEGPGVALVPIERGKPWHALSRYYFDPLALLDMPRDREKLGELAVAIATGFVDEMRISEELGFIAGFPAAVFADAIEAFRAGNYATSWTTAAQEIDGAALRARYRIEASVVETRIVLILVKGRSALFERPVRSLGPGLIGKGHLWTATKRDGDALLVHGMMPETLQQSVRIALDELPAEARAAL